MLKGFLSVGISRKLRCFAVLAFASSAYCHPPHTPAGAGEELVADSDPTDPGVPLDLVLTVRVPPDGWSLGITAHIGRSPGYPAELFHDEGVEARIELPPGLRLKDGALSWKGDLRSDEAGEIRATVVADGDLSGAIDASAAGHAKGGRVDADLERVYVLVRDRRFRIHLEPFQAADPTSARAAEKGKRKP